MNTNEIFHKMINHVVEQGEQSIGNSTYTCRYRYKPPNREVTLMCAVGCLILDEYYSSKLEGKDASTPEVRKAVESSIGRQLNEEECDMLLLVQSIHDNCSRKGFTDEFRRRIINYVMRRKEDKELNLTLPENF